MSSGCNIVGDDLFPLAQRPQMLHILKLSYIPRCNIVLLVYSIERAQVLCHIQHARQPLDFREHRSPSRPTTKRRISPESLHSSIALRLLHLRLLYVTYHGPSKLQYSRNPSWELFAKDTRPRKLSYIYKPHNPLTGATPRRSSTDKIHVGRTRVAALVRRLRTPFSYTLSLRLHYSAPLFSPFFFSHTRVCYRRRCEI